MFLRYYSIKSDCGAAIVTNWQIADCGCVSLPVAAKANAGQASMDMDNGLWWTLMDVSRRWTVDEVDFSEKWTWTESGLGEARVLHMPPASKIAS